MSCELGIKTPTWSGYGCDSMESKIELAARISDTASQQPGIRRAAEAIAAGARSTVEQVELLHRWVQTNVVYTDELGEVFVQPARLLQTRAGDCDDSAMLLAALLASMGHTAAVTFHPPRHLVAEWYWRGRWYPLETTIQADAGEDPQVAVHRLGLDRSDIVAP